MIRRAVLSGALAALLSAGPVLAEAPAETGPTERVMDALKVFPFLDRFYGVAAEKRSLIILRYNLTHDGRPATDVKISLLVGDQRIPIPLSARGKVERLPTRAELAAHAQVAIEAPAAAKFRTRIALDTTITPTQEVDAATCAQAIKQINHAIAHAAGVLSILAPKFKATTFEGADSGVAVLADGSTAPLPLIDGHPAYDPARIKDARTIRLD